MEIKKRFMLEHSYKLHEYSQCARAVHHSPVFFSRFSFTYGFIICNLQITEKNLHKFLERHEKMLLFGHQKSGKSKLHIIFYIFNFRRFREYITNLM